MFRMLEQNPEERDFDVALAFPDTPAEAALRKVQEARDWLKRSPLGRRPLVKVRHRLIPRCADRPLCLWICLVWQALI